MRVVWCRDVARLHRRKHDGPLEVYVTGGDTIYITDAENTFESQSGRANRDCREDHTVEAAADLPDSERVRQPEGWEGGSDSPDAAGGCPLPPPPQDEGTFALPLEDLEGHIAGMLSRLCVIILMSL